MRLSRMLILSALSLALGTVHADDESLQTLRAELAAEAAAAASGQRPSPLAPEEIFRPADYSGAQLSPDGKLLAVLVPINGRRNLAVIDLEKRTPRLLTSMKKVDVSDFRWIGDALLEYDMADLKEASGFLYNLGNVLVRANGELVQSAAWGQGIVRALDREGREVLIYGYDRTGYSLDAWRATLGTNKRQLLTFDQPGDVVSYTADHAGAVRIAEAMPSKNGEREHVLYYRSTEKSPWRQLQRVSAQDKTAISPIMFLPDGKRMLVWARKSADEDRGAIYYFDPEANSFGERLHASPRVDAGALLFDWTRGEPVGVRYSGRTHWLDPQWEALQKAIDAALPNRSNVLSWGRHATDRVLVVSGSDTRPEEYYLLDRRTRKLEEVAAARPWIKPEQMSRRRLVSYAARDGLQIPAYLTLPRGHLPRNLPLVVDIHGGPYVYGHGGGFDEDAQFLASRGIAVLQPNFRGSLGYGDAFHRAGWRQWGRAMQDDITDGVNWLVKQGIVDPKRVCLMGASYGGYSTLIGLAREPDTFRCGIAKVAVTDLELLFTATWSDLMRGEGYKDSISYLNRVLGDPKTDAALFRELSPVHQAARIKAPVLLAYGGEDQRVPLVHGRRMREALERNGKSVEWVVYPDEGHGFNKDANVHDFWRRVDAFLTRHLELGAGARP
ncbi:MAG TPA: S9 family peptidase [Burkholderiaceae bacterium]|nr:S9 family peptidase [Burkholderiaceae bacterium]